MHFESCWYNLSDGGNFFVLFMYVPVHLMYLGAIGCHGNHCVWLSALYYNYDWCSPKPCDHFYVIPISEKSLVESQVREM